MTFTKKELCKDVWLITEPWFAEHANLYLVRGTEKFLLIDAGVGIEDLSFWLEGQCMHPDMVIVTHAHFDHCGGLHDFATEQIFLTPEQCDAVQNPKLWGLSYLLQEDFAEEKQSAVKHYKPIVPSSSQVMSVVIDLGNYQLQVLQAGGHTNDSILLYEASQGWLFTGDLLYDGALYTDFPNTSVATWHQAIAFIKTLNPKIIFPGHNEVLQGDALRKTIIQVEERLRL